MKVQWRRGIEEKLLPCLVPEILQLLLEKPSTKNLKLVMDAVFTLQEGKKNHNKNSKHLLQGGERLEIICAALINLPELSFDGLH